MVGEAALKDRLENPIDFICADGTGIEKGTLLQLTDPRTASAVTAIGQKIAGIAAREKVANDGRTRIAVYRRGIFDMLLSGACSVGDTVAAEGNDNQVIKGNYSGASNIGTALETGTDGEVIQVYVDIGLGGDHAS